MSLEDIREEIEPQLQEVEDRILKLSRDEFSFLEKTINHLVKAGGKRIRPLITLHCAKLTGDITEKHIDLASCIELIHIASLIHDDVIDNANSRRNVSTLNKEWGNRIAILVGDYIFLKVLYKFITDIKNERLLEDFNKAVISMTVGELEEISNNHIERDIDDYLDIINKKTSRLFTIATAGSAILNSAPENEIELLFEFGEKLGYIFQITDDIMDITGDKENTGKEPLKDLEENNITLPFIYLLEDNNDMYKEMLERFSHTDCDTLKSEIITELNENDAIIKARKMAIKYGDDIKDILSEFDDGVSKTSLMNLVDWVIERNH